ncbi:MFS transporter [Rhodococcus jostii]|uniref:MFS transporter n=1 Tax=Rhodococcus jostii TaxID=132919 RepID=UPI0036558B22
MSAETQDPNPVEKVAGPGTSSRRASAAAFAGTVLEYYDLVIYGTAAALVFSDVFFADVSPQIALMLSFATFASGYIARPLGAVLFGHIGDRHGRRTALMITIWLMGAATVLIGLLPTYATVGAIAPVLLVVLRLGQGLAIGGELGGAVLISVEHAPAHRRGFFGSFSTAGGQAGTVLATGVFALVTLMPDEQFRLWGWRIPFLLSALIVIVGLIIRNKLTEPPDFQKASTTQTARKSPLRIALTHHWRAILGLMVIQAGMMAAWYFLTVYTLSYVVENLSIDRTTFLGLVTAAALLVVVMNPVWGALSDRFGRRKVLAGGLAAEGALLVVFVAALGTQNVPLILLALLAVAGIGHAAANGTYPAYLVESLPSEARYTAGSLALQLAGVVGGFIPLIAVSLEGSMLGIWATTLICFAFCLVGALCVQWLGTSRASAEQSETPDKQLHKQT